MNATGNFKPGDVTPAKLLGVKEPTQKRSGAPCAIEGKMPINEFFALLQSEEKDGGNGRKV